MGTGMVQSLEVRRGRRAERLTFLWSELWHLVDVFTGVSAVGDAESKVKIKRLEQSVFEVVSLLVMSGKVFSGPFYSESILFFLVLLS